MHDPLKPSDPDPRDEELDWILRNPIEFLARALALAGIAIMAGVVVSYCLESFALRDVAATPIGVARP